MDTPDAETRIEYRQVSGLCQPGRERQHCAASWVRKTFISDLLTEISQEAEMRNCFIKAHA
ncbi:hypothetical protein GUY40_01240 [Pseudomonas sp. R5(2019)]|nr:hypothetical protein [Pseudomonas sp. R5(2019)]